MRLLKRAAMSQGEADQGYTVGCSEKNSSPPLV